MVVNRFANLIVGLFDNTVHALDPNQQHKIVDYSKSISYEITKQKKDFNFKDTCEKLQIPSMARVNVAKLVLNDYLKKAWSDAQVTEKETASIRWLESRLHIPANELNILKTSIAIDVFNAAIAQVLNDGEVSDDEVNWLTSIAEFSGATLKEFISLYFSSNANSFIQQVFEELAGKDELSETTWSQKLQSMHKLGLSNIDILNACTVSATYQINRKLSDAKEDGVIDQNEIEDILWLLKTFVKDSNFHEYVNDEIDTYNSLQQVNKGVLPVVDSPMYIELKPGETVHLQEYCTQKRHLTSKINLYSGHLTITDYRLIFISDGKNTSTNHTKILSIKFTPRGFYLNAGGTSEGEYIFKDQTHNNLKYSIIKVAIKKANQTLVQETGDKPNRHIPRDVRQRVYQVYGGKCIDCGASSYLEYDHIIPVSKGGANTENNIQLLCRNCNLRKSDNI